MKEKVYHDMAEQQQSHWWFRARRKILYAILDKHLPSRNLKILEVGCGTGGNLLMLKRYGEVFAMEMDEFALKHVAETFDIDVRFGRLPDDIPFDGKFDVVCLFDVLEHIEDDGTALLKIQERLNPNGTIILTVPSHQWLYGSHDKMLHHFRRYSTAALKKLVSINNLKIIKFSHFNFLLFPLLVLARLMDLINKPEESTGYKTPNVFLNGLLYTTFSLERYIVDAVSFPFGGSAFVILKNNE